MSVATIEPIATQGAVSDEKTGKQMLNLTPEQMERLNALLCRIPNRTPEGTKILLPPTGKMRRATTIGTLTFDGIWFKEVSGKDFLYAPRAIAYDLEKLRLHAKRIKGFQVWHREEKTLYYCTRDTFSLHAGVIERGFGKQMFLPIEKWGKTVLGEEQVELPIF